MMWHSEEMTAFQCRSSQEHRTKKSLPVSTASVDGGGIDPPTLARKRTLCHLRDRPLIMGSKLLYLNACLQNAALT
eukprot:jgi/Botrbrau1/15409/Bobra.43_2s0035.1